MKKLTKSKRETVRTLLKQAMNAIKEAKDYTFKAYGSHEVTADLDWAIVHVAWAIKDLQQTKLPKKEAKGSECPVKGNDCPMQKKPEEPHYTPETFEAKFKELMCAQLGINADQCYPEASFVDDLGVDSLDGVELIMACEEEFNITIPEVDAAELTTYGAALEYVKKRVVDCSNKVIQGESKK